MNLPVSETVHLIYEWGQMNNVESIVIENIFCAEKTMDFQRKIFFQETTLGLISIKFYFSYLGLLLFLFLKNAAFWNSSYIFC